MKRVASGIALSLFVLICHAGAADKQAKKLIEFGWDEPGTGFMREHIQQMERAPFDGVVFNVDARRANGSKARFTWEAWGTNRFEKSDLKRAVDDLKETGFSRFTDNFLRFNTSPAKLDWFDDYGSVIQNCRVAAWAARQGGVKGLLFDIEQYEGQLFDFRQQRDKEKKSWDDYAARARERGREVIQAFQSEYPGIVLFLTFGYSLPAAESQNGKKPLAECHYGLLAPFLDGLFEAATGKVKIVDGNESAYGYRDTNRFAASYRAMKTELLPVVGARERYAERASLGFGLWMDYDWRKRGWETNQVSKNFYTPDAFRQSVMTALDTADEYVWIYTEQPRWWSESGSVKLPQSYWDAVTAARESAAKR